MFASPAITAIIIAVLCALAFGGGFTISDWRNGAEIARLQSRHAVVTAANDRCATDIEGVREGVRVITDAVGKREKAASAAMRDAQITAAKHTQAAREIRNASTVPVVQQCQAIEREQIEYVQARAQS